MIWSYPMPNFPITGLIILLKKKESSDTKANLPIICNHWSHHQSYCWHANLPIGNHWTSLIILLIVCWWIKVAHRDKGPFVFLYHYWIAHMMYCLENSHIVLVSHTNDSYLFARFYLFVLVLCNDPHSSIIYNTLRLMINLHWAWLFW